MPGLLDSLFGAPGTTTNAAATEIINGLLMRNGAGGLAAANSQFANAPAMAMQRKMQELQLQNLQSEIDARGLKVKQDARQQELLSQLLGGAPAAAEGGMSATGAAGAAPASGSAGSLIAEARRLGIPEKAIQADVVFNGGKGISDMLYKRGAPDMTVANGFAFDKNALGPGFLPQLNVSQDGKATMVRIGPDGLPVVQAPQGSLETYNAYKATGGLIDAATGAAGRVNLREMPDGTKVPVPEINENPLLQRTLGVRPQAGQPALPGAPMTASSPTNTPQPEQGVRGAFKGNAEDIVAAIQQIRDPQERANAMAALTEQARRTPDFASRGFSGGDIPAAPAAAGMGYGISTAQAIANKAAEERAVGQAKADVKATDQRANDMASTNVMLSTIDQALKHPGLPVATGLQGTLDPRNYLPGTDAKGFQALMDQIKGGTFMQAYTNLKGGGQITEIEGKKAENAIARLNTAQSTEDVTKALRELREVTAAGLARQRASNGRAGTPNSFDGDNANMVAAPLPPKPTASSLKVGQAYELPNGKVGTWNGMTFTVK